MRKDLGQILIENAKKESGGCWMQDFVPIVQKSVKEWLEEERKVYKGINLKIHTKEVQDDIKAKIALLERLQGLAIKENKAIKPEGQ